MVTESPRRLVLKPGMTESNFELAAWERNWLIREIDDEDGGALFDTWATADGKTVIHFVKDRPIGLEYVRVYSESADLIEQQIREDLDIWSAAEALDALRDADSPDGKRLAVYVVALTWSSTPDDQVIARLREAAADPDVNVRRSFVEAVGYLLWPALIEQVDELRRDDSDPVVRDDAGLLLEGIRRHGTQ
jgi:hypothetical protein